MSGPAAASSAIQKAVEPWQKAVDVFRKELTDKEKSLFVNARPEDILKIVTAQQAQLKASEAAHLIKIQP